MKIIQFGEGNFLRAFADWMMEKDSVMIVKPRPGKGLERLLARQCRYHVCIQGMKEGKAIDETERIESIAGAINPYEDFQAFLQLAEEETARFVISNTTEAGIVFDPSCQLADAPALSFPGKLTQLLFHRWKHFQGARDKGLVILPCELIFHNGEKLLEAVSQYIAHWHLDEDFARWVEECCPVYNTLVDRIVSGAPGDEEQQQFELRVGENGTAAGARPIFVKAEPYHLWVIEAPDSLRRELPLRRPDFNIVFTSNENPYHERKVTLLNAPHTVMSALGIEMGLETVEDCMRHPTLGPAIRQMMRQELLPTLLPMGFGQEELDRYISDITDRFLNPFLHHRLSSIRLNAISKCKARLLPPIQRYFSLHGTMPAMLVQGLMANIRLE